MPVLRYFVGVGGALIALLLIANVWLPKSDDPPAPNFEKPLIRIKGIQKGPERVVIDTSLPTIDPPATMMAQGTPPAPPVVAATELDPTQAASTARDAYAQASATPDKPAPKKKVAHASTIRRQQYAAQQYAMQQQRYAQQQQQQGWGWGWSQPQQPQPQRRQFADMFSFSPWRLR